MPAPLSKDIRERIIRAKERGDSHGKVSKELQVSTSAITRIRSLYRESGSYEPRPLNNGRKPRLDEKSLGKVEKRVEEQPDITLRELIEELSLPVSTQALCVIINRKLGLVRKKNGIRSRAKSP